MKLNVLFFVGSILPFCFACESSGNLGVGSSTGPGSFSTEKTLTVFRRIEAANEAYAQKCYEGNEPGEKASDAELLCRSSLYNLDLMPQLASCIEAASCSGSEGGKTHDYCYRVDPLTAKADFTLYSQYTQACRDRLQLCNSDKADDLCMVPNLSQAFYTKGLKCVQEPCDKIEACLGNLYPELNSEGQCVSNL